MYRTWQNQSRDALEVVAVQPPGRANRLDEMPIGAIPDLVDSLLPALLPLTDRPYAFFGHSMGAVFAAYVARAITDAGARPPQHLFLSSRQPPHHPSPVSPLGHLDDQTFVAEINRRYGGIPQEIINEPDILALLLPALRADILALERLEGDAPTALPIPLTAFGGDADPLVSPDMLAQWAAWTETDFRTRMFPGGHFYLDTEIAPLLQHMTGVLGWQNREVPA